MARLPDRLQKKDIIDILLREYALLKSEIHLQISSLKRHVRNVQLVVALLLGAVSYVWVDGKLPPEKHLAIWLIGIPVAVSLVCYLVYDILDAAYQISIVGARMTIIEEEVNRLAGQRILVWEQDFAAQLNGRLVMFDKWVLHPGGMIIIYMAIVIVILLIIVLWLLSSFWHLSKSWETFERPLLVFDIVFTLISATALIFAAIRFPKVRSQAKECMSSKKGQEEQRTT